MNHLYIQTTLYSFKGNLFSLCNAPSTFEWLHNNYTATYFCDGPALHNTST